MTDSYDSTTSETPGLSAGARGGIIAAFVAVFALVTWLVSGQGTHPANTDDTDDPAVANAKRWTSSVQCRDCHREAWDEWIGSQHQISYLNPDVRGLSDDFRNKACQACHLPRPVAVTGYEKRTLHRSTLPAEGISCLTCHLGADGEILARNTVADAPCAPQASPAFTSETMCASCHNQHLTTDQWRASSYPAQGISCNDCHMPHVKRGSADSASLGRSHNFHGGHDRSTLLTAVTMEVGVENGEIICRIVNVGAGHNFPSEERSRAADVMVRFDEPDTAADAATWEQAHRFRLPYRNEPLPDTSLPAHGIERITIAAPAAATAAELRFWYRRTPYVGDDDVRSTLLYAARLDLARDANGALVDQALRPLEPADFEERHEPIPEGAIIPEDFAVETTDAADAWTGGPTLDAVVLTPRTESLRAFVTEAATDAPDEAALREMADLAEAAFVSTGSMRNVAVRARRALMEHPFARQGLEAALNDARVDVRMQAAFALGELGDVAAVPALLLRAKDEASEGVPRTFIWLARALADLGNHSHVSFIARMMRHPEHSDEAGRQAIEVARNAGLDVGESPTWDALAAAMLSLQDYWVANGYALNTTAPDPLADDPAEKSIQAVIAQRLLDLLEFNLRGVDECRYVVSHLGVRAMPMLERAITAEEPYIRAHSLEVVRDLGPAATSLTPTLITLLGDPFVRVYAAEALGRLGDAAALPYLRARLEHPDPELRAKCAEALGGVLWALPSPEGETAATAAACAAELRALRDDEAQPIDVRVHAGFGLAWSAPEDAEAKAWLTQQREDGTYHPATLDEMIARIEVAARRKS